MKLKIILLTALFALVAVAGDADARKLTGADKKLVRKIMVHFGAMADIVSKKAKPDKVLDELEGYIAKNRSSLHSLMSKAEKMEAELDADAKAELEKYAQEQPELKKFMNAFMEFAMANAQDEKVSQRLQKIMEKLEPKSGKSGSKKKR